MVATQLITRAIEDAKVSLNGCHQAENGFAESGFS
jgi:hypothetical protein